MQRPERLSKGRLPKPEPLSEDGSRQTSVRLASFGDNNKLLILRTDADEDFLLRLVADTPQAERLSFFSPLRRVDATP
jgi:hypothetical protein